MKRLAISLIAVICCMVADGRGEAMLHIEGAVQRVARAAGEMRLDMKTKRDGIFPQGRGKHVVRGAVDYGLNDQGSNGKIVKEGEQGITGVSKAERVVRETGAQGVARETGAGIMANEIGAQLVLFGTEKNTMDQKDMPEERRVVREINAQHIAQEAGFAMDSIMKLPAKKKNRLRRVARAAETTTQDSDGFVWSQ